MSSLIIALAAGAATLLGSTTLEAMKCNQTSSPDVFLAYCANPQFADYEHGAYYKHLEPEAIASVERADVLVLGSSISQMTFSTEEAASYFGRHKLRYHVMGFGYTEGGKFGLAVLSTAVPHARLYIIHTYQFFSDFISKPGEDAMQMSSTGIHLRKKYGVRLAHWICEYGWVKCGEMFGSIYRDRATGTWAWSYFPVSGTKPIPQNVAMAAAPTPDTLATAEKMASALRVPRECIVVTITPNVDVDLSDQTRRIAEHIGAIAVIPQLDGLVTLDGYHLDKASSERWSSAFFSALDGAAARCGALEAPRAELR